jgi:hypothetical protein
MKQQTYEVVGPIADRDDLVHGDLLRLRNALGEVTLPLLVHDTPHHAPRQLALPHLQGVGKAVIAAAMYTVKRKKVCVCVCMCVCVCVCVSVSGCVYQLTNRPPDCVEDYRLSWACEMGKVVTQIGKEHTTTKHTPPTPPCTRVCVCAYVFSVASWSTPCAKLPPFRLRKGFVVMAVGTAF